MASVYLRGDKWWCRLKDESGRWISKATEFTASDRRKAQRYATAAQKKLDQRRSGEPTEPLTVAVYGEKWLRGREEGGVRSSMADRGRFTNHALPHLGPLLLDEVRPRHVRDMVRALREAGELAPRTILNVYGVVHTMFRDALVDELIESNPCVLHRGELPAKVDKDPEWRTSATYIVPTRNLTPIAPKDANDAFKRDLAALGPRIEAGEHRDRGGYDLRSWFITTCQEHGAHRDLLRVITHTARDVSAAARARVARAVRRGRQASGVDARRRRPAACWRTKRYAALEKDGDPKGT
jgi:hypothetical protein